MSRPFFPRPFTPSQSAVRVNGKIRAREVRLIGQDGKQLGIYSLAEALTMARTQEVDLVEIAATAVPPVCRLVDYGKFRYEQAKKDKEARKHQHADKVKELQLSASIDPHDFKVKVNHAVEFLCEDMKVKLALRFRGREMMHQEFGKQVVAKFIEELAPYGHPDAPPRVIGRGMSVMISPLPRAKRAKNPNAGSTLASAEAGASHEERRGQKPSDNVDDDSDTPESDDSSPRKASGGGNSNGGANRPTKIDRGDAGSADSDKGFANNPFNSINIPPPEEK